ncbi:hypothetical protein [Aliamphritea spongicola]|uniref:hypothetical protein n=1 Tax=Aliamphritea spongicola TaxID=707589 RepID=UPI00196B4A1F|nr:hypothetical protein [Aliamphritea spongicola]MBN3564388.1 hypothetical protein [Aliamphritea spongicola]
MTILNVFMAILNNLLAYRFATVIFGVFAESAISLRYKAFLGTLYPRRMVAQLFI